jgi:hypothetical protein
MKRVLRLLLTVAFAAAGCSTERQPPLPYAVMPREANQLGEILRHAGVEILPPSGVSPEIGAQLAGALAVALQEQDIPALTGKKLSGGHQIRGEARMENGAIVINWLLFSPDSLEQAGVEVRDALPADATADVPLPSTLVQAVTERAVTALALHFPATGGNLDEDLRIFVPDIESVPGDGGKSLPLALRNALRAAGMNIVAAAAPGVIRIEGQVLVSEQGQNQLVTLSWRVLDGSGAEIGQVNQSNPVAAGRLERNWGEIAFAAAAGAADGVIPLLEDYRAGMAGRSKE